MAERTESYGAALAELMNPEVARNPQPVYSMLREGTPVLRLDGVGVIVSSHAGVDEVLRNPEVFSSNMSAHDLKTKRPLIPLQIDPPDHRKYRKVLDPLFAPQRLRVLEKPASRLVNELIDRFIADDEIDFVRQFSTPFPSQMFLTLFGLPMEELPRFLRMKDGVIRPDQVVGHEYGHSETETYQQETADSIYAYFEEVLDVRATSEARADDVLSQLLTAQAEDDRLTRDEIVDVCFLLLIAGLDTVAASLDCLFGLLARARRRGRDSSRIRIPSPQRWRRCCGGRRPSWGSLASPTRDTDIDGFAVNEGEQVMALLGAANIDDAEFPNAGQLEWNREVNRHLAFGGGIHRCLGSHLARLELRVALREWHRRIPDYCVKPGAELTFTPGIRTLERFPMLLQSTKRLR